MKEIRVGKLVRAEDSAPLPKMREGNMVTRKATGIFGEGRNPEVRHTRANCKMQSRK